MTMRPQAEAFGQVPSHTFRLRTAALEKEKMQGIIIISGLCLLVALLILLYGHRPIRAHPCAHTRYLGPASLASYTGLACHYFRSDWPHGTHQCSHETHREHQGESCTTDSTNEESHSMVFYGSAATRKHLDVHR